MTCQYPNCNHTATRSWALVELCKSHYDVICVEHAKYYHTNGKIGRRVYEQIKHLTPWG